MLSFSIFGSGNKATQFTPFVNPVGRADAAPEVVGEGFAGPQFPDVSNHFVIGSSQPEV